jgi:metal-responsive CopG/Arc/MetJ family transcriptional regulator
MTEPTPIRPTHPGRRKRAPNGTQRYLQITVQLPPDLIAALDAQADADGVTSRSNLIRKACQEHLRRAAKRAAREE